MSLSAGARLGPYEVISIVGSGGMGEIYRARDVRLGREVAIKILPEQLAVDRGLLARFKQEARSASVLNHPHLITIHDVGEAEAEGRHLHYIAMELVRGSTLRPHLQSDDRDTLLRHLANVAEGLACAHEHGIIHRDLKPENVMISDDGFAKVVDFGLAKHLPFALGDTTAPRDTSEGMFLGTIGYMAPEQVNGSRDLDQRVDVFAFGCMLYEVVAGQRAFEGETAVDLLHNILHQEAPALPVPSLDRIVQCCLAKNRQERYQSMREVAADIREAIAAGELPRIAAPPPRRAWRWIAATLAVTAAVVALLAVVRPHPPAVRSIAVLPFSGKVAEAEFVGEGMADEIVRDLSRIDDLRVIAPTSTARYRGTSDPRAAARELKVDAALVGNLEVIGERLSLDARLVRAADGVLLWSRKYAGGVAEAATLQREVVSDLGHRVGWKTAPPRTRTRNPEAYAAYQHGRHAAQKETAPALKEAIEYFHKAIELDPDYAQAWAGLAYAHGRQGIIGVVSTRDGVQQEKAEAEKAIALDESLPDAHWYLALVASVAGDEAMYQREVARVLELDPSFAEAWLDRANHLLLQKKFAEAETLYQRARSLDPMSPHVMSSYGAYLIVMRRYDRAVTVLFNLTEQFPEYQTGIAHLATTYSYMERHAEALAQIERVNLAANPNYALWKGVILARAGRTREARTIASQTDDAVKLRFFPPYYRALLRAELGDRDEALSLLEEVKRNGDWQVKLLPHDPGFDSLRGDARFKALLK